MRNVYLNIAFVLINLMVAGCAQVRSISGGEKDTAPPVLITAIPESKSLHFSGNSFTLAFDEFVQLRDLQKELLVSPPLKSTPRVKVKQRTVEVFWEDTLRSETTYIFQFGKAIADVNESNPLPDLYYVFSTGSQLDSLMCTGKVSDANTDKPVNAGKVLLFDSLQHIFNTDARPAYFARTNEKGEFWFNYLRSGNYVLCALSDENGNNHFDIGESIDWKEGVATTRDSIVHELFTSTPRDTVVRGFDYLTDSSGVLKFHVDRWMPNTIVKSLGSDSVLQWIKADTLFATAGSLCEKRMDIAVISEGKTIDTLSIQHKADEIPRMKISYTYNPKMAVSDSVIIQAKRPITAINDSLLWCLADSAETACSSASINPLQQKFLFDNKPGKTYAITALPGWITDDCGETNDTLNLRFSIYSAKELGSLRFKLPISVLAEPHVFQLLDRSRKKVFEVNPIRSLDFVVDQLLPGDYTAVICHDKNGNGYFDPLQIQPLKKTERNYVYTGAIQVRANWEVVIDWPDSIK